MLSVVIPTLNEEQHLKRILKCLGSQTYSDFEVIVADADSSDGTREVAKAFGARVVKGGKPAEGRNAGARVAKGEILVFLDADVKVDSDFLELVWNEMQERFLDLATCEILPDSENEIDLLLHDITNVFIKISQYTDPHAPGSCIIVTNRLFKRVNGFDESLTLAEDHDFVKRASGFRPLRVLDKPRVLVSVRRLEKEGRFTLSRKYLQVELYRMFFGAPKKDIITYEFAKFDEQTPKKEKETLKKTKDILKELKQEVSSFTYLYNEPKEFFAESYEKTLKGITRRFEKVKQLFSGIITKK